VGNVTLRNVTLLVEGQMSGLNINADKPWSEDDIFDVTTYMRHGLTIEDAAVFLSRDFSEVRAKVQELRLQELKPQDASRQPLRMV
jgi:hypothetical protein